jgi:single-strand DNA-binding protein
MTGLPTLTAEGTLVGDPELRFTPSGVAVAKWRIACNERKFDKTTQEWTTASTTFLTGSCWRTLAENVAESLRKGDLITVTGSLRMREWESDDGQRHTAYEIDAHTMGPALMFTTASLNRDRKRPAGDTTAADDPWAAAAPAGDDEPPF